jgi:uncharacterized membrane protein
MKTRLQSIWESIHTSFWFFPAVISVFAIGLAYGIVRLDRAASLEDWGLGAYFYPGGPEGARLVLSTIAGSTITVAGVTFSITIAALTMASSQFGPRLLRNFMADKGNQIVLGTFVGTFIYCLVVLRTIQDNNGDSFVPEIAVTCGIVLALTSFGVLIYFFHHASSSIQAEQVVDTIYRELILEIDHTFPEESEVSLVEGAPPSDRGQGLRDAERSSEAFLREHSLVVFAENSGYLRAVDVESLISMASDRDLLIRLLYRPGDFVFVNTPLALVGPETSVDDHVHKHVRRAFILGKYRSLEQDVEFPVQQLVDMALRALSPSLNDPYTAVNCIDRLGAAICHLNGRESPPSHRYDKEGRLRLILDVHTYEGIMDAAFNQIRQSANRSPAASIRLLEALQAIAVTTSRKERREVIRVHAELIHRASQKGLNEQKDREDLEERFREVLEKLEDAGS